MDQLTEVSQLDLMIRQQVIERGITQPRVIDALRNVPRDRFFPAELADQAFADRAAPIGHGQTISQPYMVALMTEQLDVRDTDRVLEIGTGSGYHTAILSRLAKEVYSIERLKPLLDRAWERLMDLGVRNGHFRLGDGTDGWPQAAPFDRMIIGAGAPTVPTQLLLSQLKDGGIAVVPVGPAEQQDLLTITRRGDELSSKSVVPCHFVKLIGKDAWHDTQG